jgi:hypothetical protein
MSHLRPEDLAAAAKRSCRKGRHWYGDPVNVGGGITRNVCLACGAVTIDLTSATDEVPTVDEAPSPRSRDR